MNHSIEQVKALCLSSLLACAAGILIAFAVLGVIGSIVEGWQHRSEGGQHRKFNEYILVTSDGRAVIDNNWETFDLDHSPIERVDYNERLYSRDLMPRPSWSPQALRRQGLAALVTSVALNVHGNEQWFLIVDGPHDDLGYFEGFDRKLLQRVGYIGQSGFQQTRPAVTDRFTIDPAALAQSGYDAYQFLASGTGSCYLLSDGQVAYIDFNARSVTPLLEGALDMTNSGQTARGPAVPPQVAVRTSESIELFDGRGHVVSRFPIPVDLRTRPIQFYPFDQEAVLVAEMNDWSTRPDTALPVVQYEMIVARVTTDGLVESETTVSLDRRNYATPDVESFIAAGVPSPVWAFGFVVPLHVVTDGMRDSEFTSSDVTKAIATMWPGILIMLHITAYVAWKTWQHHRQTGEPGTWIWVAFVAVTGLPGYLGYRLHRHWPRIGPVPAIEPLGTEIFA